MTAGEYSKYTPDDFTSDIKKFDLFVGSKSYSFDNCAVAILRYIIRIEYVA